MISMPCMRRAAASAEPDSPWQRGDGWRLNEDNHQVLRYRDGDDGPRGDLSAELVA